MRKLLVKATEDSEDEGLVGDSLINIGQCIGQGLQFDAVVVHRHVALRSVAELSFKGDGAALLVAAEEVVDGGPDLPCR
jgi:hypothetical protein